MATFPLVLPEAQGDFSPIFTRHQAPGGRTHKSVGVPMAGPSWSFCLSDLAALSLQPATNNRSGFPTPAPIPTKSSAAASCESLLRPSVFPVWGNRRFPWDLTFLIDLRAVDFSVGLTFYLLEWSDDSQLRHANQRPDIHMVLLCKIG